MKVIEIKNTTSFRIFLDILKIYTLIIILISIPILPKKKIKVETEKEKLEWICNYQKNLDLVKITDKRKIFKKTFKKTRSSEFENEIKHIIKIKNLSEKNKSNLNPRYAINTLRLIKKIFNNEIR